MESREREAREQGILKRASAGDANGAATALLRLYGPEIFGFLLTLSHGNETAAEEAFAAFSERVWRGLRTYEGRSSVRTWAYTIARNAYNDEKRAERRHQARFPAGADQGALEAMLAEVRTETLSFLRTEKKTELERLRDSLSPEDQTLLILRVDREMEWSDLARVFLGDAGELGRETLSREAARLRKRFQLIKRRLFAMAMERGLFNTGEVR